MQPTDLTVAGCGVCMMLPGTILPPGMGVLFFLGLYFGYFPFRAEFFPPDGLLFLLQGRQAVAVFEFVLPAFTAQGGVHLCNDILPVTVRHLLGSADGARLIIAYALFLTVVSPVAGGDDRGTE